METERVLKVQHQCQKDKRLTCRYVRNHIRKLIYVRQDLKHNVKLIQLQNLQTNFSSTKDGPAGSKHPNINYVSYAKRKIHHKIPIYQLKQNVQQQLYNNQQLFTS